MTRIFDSTAIKISGAAFLGSICFSLIIFPMIAEPQRLNPDADRFGELAVSVARGEGFVYTPGGDPVLERTPLYPMLLAGVFVITGGLSLTAVQLLHAVLHAFTTLGVFHIGLKLFDTRVARLAQVLYAFHPIAIWYTARIWLETTHTFLLVMAALGLIVAFESPTFGRWLAVGILTGISCLVKPILLLFPIILAGLLSYKFRLEGFKYAIIFALITYAVIAPWTLRNYAVTGQFVPVNTSLGFNLIQGEVIGETWPSREMGILDSWQKGKQRADAILIPRNLTWESVEGDRTLTDISLRSYAGSAGGLRRVAANFCTFWYLSESSMKSFLFGALQIPLLFLTLVSLKRIKVAKLSLALPLLFMITYYVLVNSMVVGWGRYSMPMIPFLLIFSAPMIHDLFACVRRQ